MAFRTKIFKKEEGQRAVSVLRVTDALLETLGLVPSTAVAVDSCLWLPFYEISSGLHGYEAYTWCTDICKQHTYTHKN